MADESVYLEEICTPESNSYWTVSRWDDDGIEVLGHYSSYFEAMVFAASLNPQAIHKGKRDILDQIDIDGAKDAVQSGGIEILGAMREIRNRG